MRNKKRGSTDRISSYGRHAWITAGRTQGLWKKELNVITL